MFETPAHPTDRPSNAALSARFLRHLQHAVRRANELQGTVLLRLHCTLPACDPWALWQQQAPPANLGAQTSFAFNDGRMGLCAAAWGQLQGLTLQPAQRFAQAKAACARLLEQTMDVCWETFALPDADAPLAFASFAFGAATATAPLGRPDELSWEGLGGGQLLVPRTLVYRRAPRLPQVVARSHLVLGLQVAPHTSAAAQQQLLVQTVAQLQALQAAAQALGQPQAHSLPAHLARQPLHSAVQSEDADAQPDARAAWTQRVDQARAAAHSGVLDKVVLARQAAFKATPGNVFSPSATVFRLRQSHPHSICFALGHADGRSFVGASPEYLVQVSGREMTTQAVAGTAPRGAQPQADARLAAGLLGSAKDLCEHAVVADVMAKVLEPLCTELRRPSAPQLICLPRVQHLETPFEGTLRQAGGILDLVQRLHPTPSVGGWPVRAAGDFIAENEAFDRGFYAGPIGWLTAASDGVFAVAIRSVLMRGDEALAYAGAGIVAASDPQAEWRETELKLRTVREALCTECLESAPARLGVPAEAI
jgi:salicylate biosynthesis isochorismate synthase